MNFISSAVPGGEIYLFGGVLRDLAMFGRRGFDSDIDVVVNGGWSNCVDYLEKLGATRNKFGGYRFRVGTWPVDIWNARETWAIAQGFVQYRGIESLLETTVLNWDAILMNWRTKTFVLKADYFEAIRTGLLDVVLEVNPNPLGMAVRVFRHLCLKNAKLLTPRAANYLCRCAATYQYREILASEMKSYGNSFIPESLYAYFAAAGKGNGDFGGGGETVEQNIVLKSLNLN